MTAAANKVVQLDRNKPYTVVVSVTPEMAERWLANNTHNRNTRNRLVTTYARDMTAGDWLMTGESIKFSTDRMLLDGQHRLKAVIKSGHTVTMFITYNLPPESQSAMDTGAKRTASDALGLAGEKNSSLLAATIRLVLAMENRQPSRSFQVTNAELADRLSIEPGLRDIVAFVKSLHEQVDCATSMIGYCHWRFSQIDPVQSEKFWNAAAFKIGLSDGDPTLALTSRFTQAIRDREKLSAEVQLSMIFRAWNAWRVGKTMRLLRVKSPSGDVIPIPEPR